MATVEALLELAEMGFSSLSEGRHWRGLLAGCLEISRAGMMDIPNCLDTRTENANPRLHRLNNQDIPYARQQ